MSKKGQSIQVPLLIKIEPFSKSGKNKKCFADCNEKCSRKSYTIFDPKPPRRKSKIKDEQQSKESAENTLSPRSLSLTNRKEEPYSDTSTVNTIHSPQEPNIFDDEELSAVKSEPFIHENSPKNSKHSEIVNSLTTNIKEIMAGNSDTPDEQYRNSHQRIGEVPPNELINPEDKNSIVQYCKPDLEMEQQCLCIDLLQGHKRTATEIMKYPRKLLRKCDKNGIKFCSKKSDQDTNPDYTIEISVELAQNKKKKGSQVEQKKNRGGIVDSNETENTGRKYEKSAQSTTDVDQNDNYIDEKSKYHDLSKYQKVDYPTRIAKISDRRTLTTRQPKSMNEPEEISISVDTSRVEISTDEGKQTLLKNKRTTKIRSSYAEWDADGPDEQPRALMSDYDRASTRFTEKKSISPKRKPIDSQHPNYMSDQENESSQYMQYEDNDTRRDELSDQMKKKLVTQNEQLPAKSSRDFAAKSIGPRQIEGSLYKRTTKMRTDGDINQPDKFSVISEVEEGELYLTPKSREKTLVSELDPNSRHLSVELDEVMDPDQWSFDEKDIVEKRRNLFERARALSAGLLERARTLSAAAQSEKDNEAIASTMKRGISSSAEEAEDDFQRREQKIRSTGVSQPDRYQDHDIQSNIEEVQQSRGMYRALQSAPPSSERDKYGSSGIPSTYEEPSSPLKIISGSEEEQHPKYQNIASSTFSPPMSLASFIERNRHGSRSSRSVVSSRPDGYSTPGIIREGVQPVDRYTHLQSPALSTSRDGYLTSEEHSHVEEDGRSGDKYPTSDISKQPDAHERSEISSYAGSRGRYHTSEVPSRAGSGERYPEGSSAQRDEYQASEVPSRAGSRDRYFAGSSAQRDEYQASEVPSRAGSRERYPVGSSAQRDEYQASEVPSRAGSRERYPVGSSAQRDEYQASEVSSRAGSGRRYPGDTSAQRDEYQASEVPSRVGSRDRYPSGSSAQRDGGQTSEISSRAGSGSRYLAGSSAQRDEYQGAEVPSRAGSRDRYPSGSSTQPDGYQKSEISSRVGSRDRYPPFKSPDTSSQAGKYLNEDREPSSRYPSILSGVGPSTGIDKVKTPSRKLSDDIAAAQMHLPFRDVGASTASGMSMETYIQRGPRSRVGSPAVSIQPLGHRESDIPLTIEPDHDSRGSYRPPGIVPHQLEGYPESEKTSFYAGDDELKPVDLKPYGRIAPLDAYKKSGCVLMISVLEKHVDGCTNKRKIGELETFCGYDVLSRQIFETCLETPPPFALEEGSIGRSTVGSLQSGRRKLPKTASHASQPTPTEEFFSEMRAAPVYSEKKSLRETDSTEEKPSETESYVGSEVTSVKEDDEEKLQRGSLASKSSRAESGKEKDDEEKLQRTSMASKSSRAESDEEKDADEELKRTSLASKSSRADSDKEKGEDDEIKRTSSIAESEKDKSDKISDTDTTVSSVTSKKSSFSGHLPDFRSMAVKQASINRKPLSMFKWFKTKKTK